MNRHLWAVGVVAVVAALGSCALGDDDLTLPRCSPLPPYFCADVWYFGADSSSAIEVCFGVCNEGLQFVKTGAGYAATADLSVILKDGKGNQVAGDTYRIKLYSAQYAGTTSVDSCHTRVVSFKAKPGDFKMLLGLYDRDSRVKSEIEAALRIPSLAASPSLSDVELLLKGSGVHEGMRRGYIPNVKRIYTTERDSIPFYYEVYHGGEYDSLGLTSTVSRSDGSKIYDMSGTSVGPGTVAHLWAIPADTLPNGRYTLRVALKSEDGKVLAARLKDFEVRHEGFYLNRDLDQAVALLTYIAGSSEIEAFKKANEEERKRIWEDFWRAKDPTPGTPRNEYFEEYLRRFRYANDHFSVPLSQGWKTDRGRIYMLYGEPDQIDSYPLEMDRKPTEIWYYYSQSRRFVFVDDTGFGDYVLVGG